MFPNLYIKPSHEFSKVTTSRFRPKRIFYKDTITTLYYSSPVFREYMNNNPESARIDGLLFHFASPIRKGYSYLSHREILTMRDESGSKTPVIMSPDAKFVGSGIKFETMWDFNIYLYEKYSNNLPKNLALLQYNRTPNRLPHSYGVFLSEYLLELNNKDFNLYPLFYYFIMLNCNTKQESHCLALFKYTPDTVRESLIKQALELYTRYFILNSVQPIIDNEKFIELLQRYMSYKMFSLCINYLPTEEVYDLTKSFRHLWTLNEENLILIEKSLNKLASQAEDYKIYKKNQVIKMLEQSIVHLEDLLVSLDESESAISNNLLRTTD